MSTQFALDLRLARRKAGYTQSDLAHLMACHQTVISSLERGHQRPNLVQIIELSLIYGRSFESLFGAVMTESKEALLERLQTLPELDSPTAHNFNRESSLTRLKRRLSEPEDHDAA